MGVSNRIPLNRLVNPLTQPSVGVIPNNYPHFQTNHTPSGNHCHGHGKFPIKAAENTALSLQMVDFPDTAHENP